MTSSTSATKKWKGQRDAQRALKLGVVDPNFPVVQPDRQVRLRLIGTNLEAEADVA